MHGEPHIKESGFEWGHGHDLRLEFGERGRDSLVLVHLPE